MTDSTSPSRASFIFKVAHVQTNAKSHKGQKNQFGNYDYRNCEDIMQALKPHLDGLAVVISDEIVEVAGRVYIKATVTVTDGVNELTNSAFAREADQKKGMDSSQLTGSCSSYARKYALSGMFLIDNNKDADSMDNRQQQPQQQQQQQQQPQQNNGYDKDQYLQNRRNQQIEQHQQQGFVSDGPENDYRKREKEQNYNQQAHQDSRQPQTATQQHYKNIADDVKAQRQQTVNQRAVTAPDSMRELSVRVVVPQQVKQLVGAIQMAGMDSTQFCNMARIKQLGELTQDRFQGAMDRLKSEAMRVTH